VTQAVSPTALVMEELPPISRCLLAVCDPRLRLDCAAAAGEPPEAFSTSQLPDAFTRLLRALADVRDWPRAARRGARAARRSARPRRPATMWPMWWWTASRRGRSRPTRSPT